LGEKEEVEQEEQVEFPAKAGLPDFVHQKTREVLEYWMDGRRHILVNALFVLPQHQKAGVGKLLLGKMHEFADRERIPAFLQATPFGYRLYKKAGWKQVGKLEVDLRKWIDGPEGEEEDGPAFGWGVYEFRYMTRLPEP
jgi:GNAT superfamily N-acetyltransferase